jgi:hypothetical protein
MSHIIKFTPTNTSETFTLDIKTYAMSSNNLHSHILLSEYNTTDGSPPDIGLINLFTSYIVHDVRFFNTGYISYLYYISATIELSLPMYSASDYLKKIELKLLEVAGKYDLLITGNKKLAFSYNEKMKDIEKKICRDIETARMEFNKEMANSHALICELEDTVTGLNARIAKQSLATEERVKKIETLVTANETLTAKLSGECGICLTDCPTVPVECCANKCCVSCFIKSTSKHIFKCPYCRRETS